MNDGDFLVDEAHGPLKQHPITKLLRILLRYVPVITRQWLRADFPQLPQQLLPDPLKHILATARKHP